MKKTKVMCYGLNRLFGCSPFRKLLIAADAHKTFEVSIACSAAALSGPRLWRIGMSAIALSLNRLFGCSPFRTT